MVVFSVAIVSLVIAASWTFVYWSKCGRLLGTVGDLSHEIMLQSGTNRHHWISDKIGNLIQLISWTQVIFTYMLWSIKNFSIPPASRWSVPTSFKPPRRFIAISLFAASRMINLIRYQHVRIPYIVWMLSISNLFAGTSWIWIITLNLCISLLIYHVKLQQTLFIFVLCQRHLDSDKASRHKYLTTPKGHLF